MTASVHRVFPPTLLLEFDCCFGFSRDPRSETIITLLGFPGCSENLVLKSKIFSPFYPPVRRNPVENYVRMTRDGAFAMKYSSRSVGLVL